MEELVLEPTLGVTETDAQGGDAGRASAPVGLLDQLKQLPAKLMASPQARPAMLFGAGLLIGWVLLGWLIFPIKWTNTDPWDMRGAHQERFVLMMAEYYWQTEDLGFVLDSINGWDRTDLDKLVADLMASKESTPAQRAQLTALGDALSLPLHQSSLLASLLGGSTGLIVAVVLAMVPLLGGLGLVVTLGLRQVHAPTVEDELAELENELAASGGRGMGQDDIWNERAEEEEEEEEDGEEEERGSGLAAMAAETNAVDEEISDMLSTFFDDDDQSLEQLQALTKGLGEVNVDHMLRTMQGMVQLFQMMPPQS